MNTLIDVKNLMEKNDIVVDTFSGYILECCLGTIMLGSEGYTLNKELITEKDLVKLIDKSVKVKK